MFSLFQIAWQLTENPLLLYFMFMRCLLIIMNHSANTACSQAGRKIFLPQMRQVFQMWEPREGYKGSSVPSWSLRHDSGWEREMMSRPNRLPCDTTTATVRVQIHIFTLVIYRYLKWITMTVVTFWRQLVKLLRNAHELHPPFVICHLLECCLTLWNKQCHSADVLFTLPPLRRCTHDKSWK